MNIPKFINLYQETGSFKTSKLNASYNLISINKGSQSLFGLDRITECEFQFRKSGRIFNREIVSDLAIISSQSTNFIYTKKNNTSTIEYNHENQTQQT